jgi:hypothetical protein
MSNYRDPRWQKRRLQIMDRDGWGCVNCKATDRTLHVHHKRYHGEPWEAGDDDLQSLCEDCHEELGPHPKAGLWWAGGGDYRIVAEHCPSCGSTSLTCDELFYRCGECACVVSTYYGVHAPGRKGSPGYLLDVIAANPAKAREVLSKL